MSEARRPSLVHPPYSFAGPSRAAIAKKPWIDPSYWTVPKPDPAESFETSESDQRASSGRGGTG